MPREKLTSEPGFSTTEVASLAAVTHRQVGYWVRTRLVIPSIRDAKGKGNFHRFDLRDALTIAALGRFRSRGLSLQALRRVQRCLEDREDSVFQDVHARLVFVPGTANEVLLAKSAEEVVSLLEQPGQAVAPVIVDLSEVFGEVAARVVDIKVERKRYAAQMKAAERERKRAGARKAVAARRSKFQRKGAAG